MGRVTNLNKHWIKNRDEGGHAMGQGLPMARLKLLSNDCVKSQEKPSERMNRQTYREREKEEDSKGWRKRKRHAFVNGPWWWWSGGQRSCLLLRQSEFASSWSLQFYYVDYLKRMKINEKRPRLANLKANWHQLKLTAGPIHLLPPKCSLDETS